MNSFRKLKSLSIFFPCYNDAATIPSLVILSFKILKDIAEDYEVLVIDDGSNDYSHEILEELKNIFPKLKVIYHEKNLGYGAVLQRGFKEANKDFIFYTDGDGQYNVKEVCTLIALMNNDVDIVNGFKVKRSDPFYRIILGKIYHWTVKLMFGLKIKDVDCDFRLMRKCIFEKVKLEYNSGVICLEMIKKIQDAGFRFRETGVKHYFRTYGKSQFFNIKRILKVGIDVLILWYKLMIWNKLKQRKIF